MRFYDEWICSLSADVPGIPIERLQIIRKLLNHEPEVIYPPKPKLIVAKGP